MNFLGRTSNFYFFYSTSNSFTSKPRIPMHHHHHRHIRLFSGTGTYLKVGGHRSRAKVGALIRRQAPENNFLVVRLHFLALKAQLVVLVSAFVIVSTVWSVYCLLFFYSRCPPCPAICESGGTWPPVLHGPTAFIYVCQTI